MQSRHQRGLPFPISLTQMEIPHCPTLYPSWKEFRHFQAFVEKVERDCKKDYGMVKVKFSHGAARLALPLLFFANAGSAAAGMEVQVQ